MEMEGERDKPTIQVGDFNICLLVIDRASKQKIGKDTDDLEGRGRMSYILGRVMIQFL